MKLKIAAWCLWIGLLSCSLFVIHSKADGPQVYNAESIYELAADTTFYLRVLREDGTLKSVGTGVMLTSDGIAVTAYHVVKGGEQLEALLKDGRIVRSIRVTGYDEQKDVAVLKLPAPTGKGRAYKALPIRTDEVKHGEQVFAIGYPLRNTAVITEGIVNAPKAEVSGQDRILVSAQIASGMSGGPLLDKKGRLAGMISGSFRTMNNIHLIVNMEDLGSILPEGLRLEGTGSNTNRTP